jgi:porin
MGLPGTYRVGYFYYTGRFDTYSQKTQKGNYGYYAMFEQKVWEPNELEDDGSRTERGIYPLASITFAPKNRNFIPFFFNVGVIYKGPFDVRPDDVLALGYAYGKFSTDLRHLQRQAQAGVELNSIGESLIDHFGDEPQNFESVIELDYWIQVTPWFSFTPDLQYIINPNGTNNIPNALIVGAEIAITF